MINPGLFFLFIMLVVPGFLALRVFNCLLTKSIDRESFWDITYNSVIHSLFIYIILYPIAYAAGINIFNTTDILDFVTSSKWMPLLLLVIIMLFSVLYGIAYGLIYRKRVIEYVLKKFFKKAVEPPNILADLIDPKYGTNMDYWVTFQHMGNMYSGGIRMARLEIEPRELLIEKIHVIDPVTREDIMIYPHDLVIWIKLDDDINLLELKAVPKN